MTISVRPRGPNDDSEKFSAVREGLTERFGGLTAFTRSPTRGTTQEGNKTVRDEIIVFEILTETLDESWWTSYRRRLEADFQQDKIIVRASAVTLL